MTHISALHRCMLLRMTDAKATEAARELLSHRWGNQVPEKAAQVVISRADELSPSTRAEVIGALTDAEAGNG